jgi:hypothetical protein
MQLLKQSLRFSTFLDAFTLNTGERKTTSICADAIIVPFGIFLFYAWAKICSSPSVRMKQIGNPCGYLYENGCV